MITIQKYVRPQSLEEAWQLNQSKRNRIIGGMLWLRLGNGSIDTAIDLCDLNFNTITETEQEFIIGAMTPLRDLELHEGLNTYTQYAIRDALKNIVGVQFRNMATIGGSIWGRFGFSDVLTVLLATDCYVELFKGGVIPLSEFAAMKKDNDLLVNIRIRKTAGKFTYTSMRNQRTDFPVLTCAVSETNGIYRAVIGARPGRAMMITDQHGILSDGITEASAKAFAAYVAQMISTGSNLRGSADYRTHLIKVLTTRSVQKLGGY